jgi:hypothetical protein
MDSGGIDKTALAALAALIVSEKEELSTNAPSPELQENHTRFARICITGHIVH